MNPLQCVNCKGVHAAYSRSCPEWKKEKEIITIKTKENVPYHEARKRVEFAQRGTYMQAVQRGQAPSTVSVGTQVELKDLVAAVRPSKENKEGTPSASSNRGPKTSTAVGSSQHSVEVTQASMTVLRSQPLSKRVATSQSTDSKEHPGGADSMDVCPSDTEGMGDPASLARPPRQPVIPPCGRGKGGRNVVSAPNKK